MKTRLFALLASLAVAGATSRAQTPGDPDTSFAAGPTANAAVYAVALQANGQVLAGGSFDTFRGASRSGVARLNTDGSLDAFNPGLALTGIEGSAPTVFALAVQPADQKILVGGTFNVLGQRTDVGLARLLPTGQLDTTFNAGAGAANNGGSYGDVAVIAVLGNGEILAGGSFLTFGSTNMGGLVLLETDGSVDPAFNAGGAGFQNATGTQSVAALAVQSDGKILVGGSFQSYDGQAVNGIARLNANGSLDTSFNAGTAISGDGGAGVAAIAVQANGQVLVGGNFNVFDGVTTGDLVRLNSDGSLDTSYAVSTYLYDGGVNAIIVQPDGSAIIGGDFRTNAPNQLVTGPLDGLVHVFADGTVDTSFNSGNDDQEIQSFVLQPDGKVVAASDSAGFGATTGDVYRFFDILPVPTVTLTVGTALTNENSGSPATFILTLSAPQTADLKILYTIKGSAQNGTDYQALSGHAKIKAGNTTKTIKVTPIDRGIGGGGKVAVKLTLAAGTGYMIAPGSAPLKVKIEDND